MHKYRGQIWHNNRFNMAPLCFIAIVGIQLKTRWGPEVVLILSISPVWAAWVVLSRVLGEHFFQTGGSVRAQCPPERQRLRAALTSPVLCASVTHPAGAIEQHETEHEHGYEKTNVHYGMCAKDNGCFYQSWFFISKSIYMLQSGYYRNIDITFAKQLIATCVYISSKLVLQWHIIHAWWTNSAFVFHRHIRHK